MADSADRRMPPKSHWTGGINHRSQHINHRSQHSAPSVQSTAAAAHRVEGDPQVLVAVGRGHAPLAGEHPHALHAARVAGHDDLVQQPVSLVAFVVVPERNLQDLPDRDVVDDKAVGGTGYEEAPRLAGAGGELVRVGVARGAVDAHEDLAVRAGVLDLAGVHRHIVLGKLPSGGATEGGGGPSRGNAAADEGVLDSRRGAACRRGHPGVRSRREVRTGSASTGRSRTAGALGSVSPRTLRSWTVVASRSRRHHSASRRPHRRHRWSAKRLAG
mmetsp:Transcript_5459/g.12491  ORF Transcript_5459/g.12491 Transcript_5459/m.12491 type:complete len:273 (-) Transcript_5459:623-1441(-)